MKSILRCITQGGHSVNLRENTARTTTDIWRNDNDAQLVFQRATLPHGSMAQSGYQYPKSRINFHNLFTGLTLDGKHAWQQEDGQKRRYQYCTDISGTIIYLRALQGHSGRNLIDPSLQDKVIIQRGFFQHIYHTGCAF